MSTTGVHQFTLTDAEGQPHDYLVTEHPGGDGMGIMFDLLALGAPTVMSLAGAAMKSGEMLEAILTAYRGGGDGGAITKSDTSEFGKLLAGLDLASVGTEIGRALATGQPPHLTRKLLSPQGVFRDGKPLSIDLAYQANYLELLNALWKVCSVNRFFPVPSTLLASSNEPKAAKAAGATTVSPAS